MSGDCRNGGDDGTLAQRVFEALAPGGFRSGERLAAELGVSRSAVWKAVERLRSLQAEIHAVPNRGYRLAQATVPLDARRVAAALSPQAAAMVHSLRVAWSLGSTNAQLLEAPPPPAGRASVLLAEHQSAGRGRRGRTWIAPLGGAICLSIGWSLRLLPPGIGALGLAIGVCVRRALMDCGVQAVGLKWPNDLVADDGKLGGILIELRAEAGGPAFAAIGIGLNVTLGARLRTAIAGTGTCAADLISLGLADVDRNRLAACVTERCLAGLQEFDAAGFQPFVAEWRAADTLCGREVTAHVGGESLVGIARGIDLSGALLLETAVGPRALIAGEVTVRAGS
ncbi:MAG: biotin--[acetyl-CoA-carboxylase] ligase [Gammaproteobacteria bacterium]|nr:biotin--[acetyl-CoA-carboxylase] ligase [Gammaproteobacteria bacterium]